MKLYTSAALALMLMSVPALAQTTNTSPAVDANGVSVNDQAKPVSTMTKDINSPYNHVRYEPRGKNKMKGAAGGGGLPTNGLAAGGGGPASTPPTHVEHN